MVGLTVSQSTLVVGVIAVTIVIALLYWFFGTELGNALRATGNNEQMVRAVGVNTDYTKLLGLVISNALIALSMCLWSVSQLVMVMSRSVWGQSLWVLLLSLLVKLSLVVMAVS